MSSFENLWKSKLIFGPLHPSDMVYEMCSSLICLKTAEETCFRLFYHPALKVPSVCTYPIREGWIFSKDDRALRWAGTSCLWQELSCLSHAGWRRGRSRVLLPFPSAHLLLPACQKALHCLVSAHLGKMSDKAAVCHETKRSGNCYNIVNYSIIWGKVRCHCIVSVGLGI